MLSQLTYFASLQIPYTDSGFKCKSWGISGLSNDIEVYGEGLNDFMTTAIMNSGTYYLYNLPFESAFIVGWLTANGYKQTKHFNDDKSFMILRMCDDSSIIVHDGEDVVAVFRDCLKFFNCPISMIPMKYGYTVQYAIPDVSDYESPGYYQYLVKAEIAAITPAMRKIIKRRRIIYD